MLIFAIEIVSESGSVNTDPDLDLGEPYQCGSKKRRPLERSSRIFGTGSPDQSLANFFSLSVCKFFKMFLFF